MKDWRDLLGALGLHPGRVRARAPRPRPLDGACAPRAAPRRVEILIVVGLATAGVAALQSTTSDDAGLGSLYLLAVLLIAIRRGQLAALVTAVLGVLDAQLLLHRAAPPAGDRPLAGPGRADRAADRGGRGRAGWPPSPASARPRPRAARVVAAAREREAKLVAEVASAILAGESIGAQLETIGDRVALATAAGARPRRARAGADGDAGRDRGAAARARRQRLAVPDDDVALGPERDRARGRVARAADRRGRRAGAGLRAGGRDRGLAPRRGREDRDPARDLPRSALAADRDHDRGLGARDRRRHRGRARGADRGDRDRERAPGQAGRRPARPVADRVGRGGAAGGLVRPARRRRLGRGARLGRPSDRVRSCPATCRWCGPTPPSSSGCSRT